MPDSRFRRGVIWNFAAFVFMGITGIVLNLVIGRFYGPSVLGIFNQVFSIYIVLSQFAVLGLWLSVLRYVAEFSEDQKTLSLIYSSAMILGASIAAAVSFGSLAGVGWIEALFDSRGVARAWPLVLPGFWCYSLNKVLMAVLNGRRDMGVFAGVQIFRYASMLILLCAMTAIHVDTVWLPSVIAWPEIPIFLALIWRFRSYITCFPLSELKEWFKRHISFGVKSFMSGTLAELNTRVDVIMLGIFTTDANVGIYSMAAMMAEGMAQLSTVVRDNVNPLITRYIASKDWEKLALVTGKYKRYFYLFMGAVALAAVGAFPHVVAFLTGKAVFGKGWGVFGILALGIVSAAGYLPLNMILAQAGYPGFYTMFKGMTVLTNISLNAVLIPVYGLYGAAAATALTYFAAMWYLKLFVKRVIGVRI